jgi:hypothetical protein
MNSAEKLFVEYWSLVIDQLGGSPSYSDLAELTHETQVELFGWCVCEDNEGNENPYSDCPSDDSERRR